jgi:hypothetical protein
MILDHGHIVFVMAALTPDPRGNIPYAFPP